MMPRFLLATALVTFCAAAPAYAGFTLVAPDDSTAATAVPVAPVQTAPAGNMMAAAPVTPPQQTTVISSAPNNVTRTRVGPPVVELSAMPAPAAPQAFQTMTAPATASAQTEPVVHGFGKDIPLVIAAQQIAPADRQIAFGQGVDPSMPITWHGGQPWHNVLSSALQTRGLQLAEQGNILFISQSNASLGTGKASLLMQPQSSMSTPTTTATPIQQQPSFAPAPMAAPMPTASGAVTTLPTMTMPPEQPEQPMQQTAQMGQPPMAMAPSPAPMPVMPPTQTVVTPTVVQPPIMAPQPAVMTTPMMPTPVAMAPSPAPMPAMPPTQTVVTPTVVQPPVMAPQPAVMTTPMMPTPVAMAPAPVPVKRLPDISQPIPVSAVAAAPQAIGPISTVSDSGSWQASTGRTLKQTLEDWSHRANVTLRWDNEFDYPVQSTVNVDGDYETAVRSLLKGFSSAQPQPVARLYRPVQGAPGVLLVTARGNDLSQGK